MNTDGVLRRHLRRHSFLIGRVRRTGVIGAVPTVPISELDHVVVVGGLDLAGLLRKQRESRRDQETHQSETHEDDTSDGQSAFVLRLRR